MSVQGDNLKIPIEIKTDDLNEIRKLINDITNAEGDLKTLRPRKGRGNGDDSSRSAFGDNKNSAFSKSDDNRGGIFGGQQGDALPTQGRDKDSKTPVQKENQFAKLQKDVAQQEAKISGLSNITSGLNAGFQGAVNLATSNSKGELILGKLGGLASKAFLPLTIITTIVGLVQSVLDAALAPGGPLDRRFRRQIDKESANTISLEKKNEINQGFKIIRTQTHPSIRGESGTSSSARVNQIYDMGLESSMAGLP
jgi:hypothetical protein